MNRWISSGIALLVVLLLVALNLAAQDPVPPPTPVGLSAFTSPDSRSDWNLEIRSSGGLDGRGSGGFTLSSTGTLTCILPRQCPRSIEATALQPIHGFVMAANLPLAVRMPGSNPSVLIPIGAGVCMDCIVTTMFLRIRDSMGLEWTYSLSWDPTTISNIPSDFKQLFQTATALAK